MSAAEPGDVEAGLRHALALAQDNEDAARRAWATVEALVAALVSRGVVAPEAVGSAGAAGSPWSPYDLAPVVRPAVAPSAVDERPDIDCVALFPLCGARCCEFNFALSETEIERGVTRWDPRRPYFIRQGAHGRCVHQCSGGACGVYEDRPQPCRVYHCKDDPRIWVDFDRKIPNPHPSDGPSRMRLPLRWVVSPDPSKEE